MRMDECEFKDINIVGNRFCPGIIVTNTMTSVDTHDSQKMGQPFTILLQNVNLNQNIFH